MKWPRRRLALGCPVSLEGVGIHTGRRAAVWMEPAPEHSGLTIRREDTKPSAEWRIQPGRLPHTDASRRMTALISEAGELATVEHLLAALWCLGVSDAVIRVEGGELPVLDGSAAGFVEALKRKGRLREGAEREIIQIQEPIFVSAPCRAVLALPDDHFSVAYTLDTPFEGLRQMSVDYDAKRDDFETEYAVARTFCSFEEAQKLKEAGFGKGATPQNTLIVGSSGPMGNSFRFSDECARHKVLDLIGDLALLGADLSARIVSVRGGHDLNQRLARMIVEANTAKENR